MARPKAAVVGGVVVLALLGVILSVVAVTLSGDEVFCGDKTMQPGQRCLLVTDTGSGWHSYEQLQAEQKGQLPKRRAIGGGLGAVFLVGAVVLLIAGTRQDKKEQAQIAAAQAWTRGD
ncbi:hypothetical protein Cme02nite_19830 [Catellatospora methionotrophica]|uniref:Transmembrane protein n=1 Tax=Catellatospora methionotrophica TaxID=121620 RepID=A0A8J3PDL9_9ACTN|nr:hypothetical protein [Catellatospora methionotrophica]GIG13651.1 hypothetical protein Cme02nite_19830 [Catellatospora methionotrophica]